MKGVDLELPQGGLICFVGVSGSGKSTLAFDVIGAEAERRFLESLSPFARQLLGPMRRPEVDRIEGLQPPILIRRAGRREGPRSTVGTATEIYDHLRILFARAGQTHCPRCGRRVRAMSREEMVDELLRHAGKRVLILVPIKGSKGVASRFLGEGFIRAWVRGQMVELESLEDEEGDFDLVVDRLILRPEARERLRESLELALRYGKVVKAIIEEEEFFFSPRPYCPYCDLIMPSLVPALFSFNSPEGACPECGGLGESPKGELCPRCGGKRLREEALSVKLYGWDIASLSALPVERLSGVLRELAFPAYLVEVVEGILRRVSFLREVGVGYLSLDRAMATLSAGEAQRVRLASQLGMGLSGVLYLLDEPSVGLHPRDQIRIVKALKDLREQGNTVIVVEHDPMTIREADWIVELGPGAGEEGGQVVFSGGAEEFLSGGSLTGRYLKGELEVGGKGQRRRPKGQVVVKGAFKHNLKGITVRFPLGVLCCVTGVSGSGKSTLVLEVLGQDLKLLKEGFAPQGCSAIEGADEVRRVAVVDQSPPGRDPRSNPATYMGVFAVIRHLFAQTHEARVRGWSPSRFSFNVKGGRCEVCKGLGRVRVELGFLPEVFVTCEHCGGTRYEREVLEVKYRGMNIAEVLQMTVEEARDFFKNIPQVRRRLDPLQEVGLGYLRLGQPLDALSGGEAQRLKLARELTGDPEGTLYLLDEPTTGLHPSEIEVLLRLLDRLIEKGGTVIVIEHNLDVVKNADYVIDLGPEGGERGGEVVAEGTPEEMSRSSSLMAPFLLEVLEGGKRTASL